MHPLVDGEPYYLGVFLVGAYQETLGDLHNLMGDTNVVSVRINEDGTFDFVREMSGDSIADVLSYVEYEPQQLLEQFRKTAEQAVRDGRDLASPSGRRSSRRSRPACAATPTTKTDPGGPSMAKVLIIGAGGVGQVVTHKCAQVPEVFSEIVLASRTEAKCKSIAADVLARTGRTMRTAQVDADKVPEMTALIEREKPALVINVALPYQDLPIMDACLAAGVDYLDTANYEPRDTAKFEYSWQWAYQDRFRERGLMALLGCGFDPGRDQRLHRATSPSTTSTTIDELDIIDCNARRPRPAVRDQLQPRDQHPRGHRARPVLGERRVDRRPTRSRSTGCTTSPTVSGRRRSSSCTTRSSSRSSRTSRALKRARFWMTFSDNYLTHLRVLRNVGMTAHRAGDVPGPRDHPAAVPQGRCCPIRRRSGRAPRARPASAASCAA